MQAVCLTFQDIKAGLKVSLPFAVSGEDMKVFADLSGDYSPLHADAQFARSRGFEGPLVYGGLIVAQVSRLIGMRLPGRYAVWSRIEMDFRNPLMIDEAAQVEAEVSNLSEAVRQIELKLRITAGDQLIAKGKAEVMVRDDG